MALTKITSRILDSSGVTILGTITTGVWQGSVIAEAYLQNQSGTNTGDQTNISGNAGTATLADEATILANTRNINGVAFNGSTNITIADATKLPLAGGTLTGALVGTSASFTRLEINATNVKLKGDLLGNSDAAYDIGASGANRPRNLYLSNSISAADITTTGAGIFGGNVGIGGSPSVNLEIAKSGARIKLIDGTNQLNMGLWDGSNYRIEGDANRKILITSYHSDGIHLGGSGNSHLVVKGGNVGIGTTSPTTALTISKAIASAAYGQQASMIEFKSYFPGYDVETVKSAIYSGVSATGSLNTEGGFLAFHVNNNGTMGEKLRIDKSGDATFSNLIKTPQGIVLQGNGIPSGKTGLSSSGDGNHMRFYIGGVHTVTGMTTSEIVHEVQSTTGIRYQQNANEAIRRKEIFKAFAASGGVSSANWCRLYIPHFYANGPQGVRAEIKICYHPVHASNAAYYEYVLYTSSYTAARPMYAKVRLVHEETGFGWNYYAINNAVNFVIGDTSGNIGRYIYMNIVGGHSSYNKARSIHVVATGGSNISDLTLDTGVAAPSVSAAITIGGGPALSPG